MPKGQKTCPSCGKTCGCRSLSCPHCDASFGLESKAKKPIPKPPKRKRSKVEQVKWNELEQGMFIKVIQGTGPYYLNKECQYESMGYHGKFMVHSIDDNGIHAYPTGKSNGGHSYIYMGEEKVGKSGCYLQPHKIEVIKQPKITNIVTSRAVK